MVLSRARALKRAAIAYGLWIGLQYLLAGLVPSLLGISPVSSTIYWLPFSINWFVIRAFPGIIAAVVAYFWRGRFVDKAAISAAFLLGATLWLGLFSVVASPMPTNLIEDAAAMRGFTKCGEYRANPGHNIFTVNMTLDAATTCYYIILRPEPRHSYAIRFISPEVVTVKVLPESRTNVYRFSSWLYKDSFSRFYYLAHHVPEALGGAGLTVGDYEKIFDKTNAPQPNIYSLHSDDFVLWFAFKFDYSDLGRGQYVKVHLYNRVEFYVERVLP